MLAEIVRGEDNRGGLREHANEYGVDAEALDALARLERIEIAVRELEAEGWLALWSKDPRVRAIREALS